MAETNAVSSYFTYLNTHVLGPISKYISREKGVHVTTSELLEAIGASQFSSATMGSQYPDVPSRSNNASPAPASTPKGRTPKNYSGPTCQYKLKKGDHKGELCARPCPDGAKYCRYCKDKKHDDEPSTNGSTTSKSTAKNSTKTQTKPVEQEEVLDLSEISNGRYREAIHNIAVILRDEQYIALGTFTDGSNNFNTLKKLTPSEIEYAVRKGMTVNDSKAEDHRENGATNTKKYIDVGSKDEITDLLGKVKL